MLTCDVEVVHVLVLTIVSSCVIFIKQMYYTLRWNYKLRSTLRLP